MDLVDGSVWNRQNQEYKIIDGFLTELIKKLCLPFQRYTSVVKSQLWSSACGQRYSEIKQAHFLLALVR